jgi:hypothetical protein
LRILANATDQSWPALVGVLVVRRSDVGRLAAMGRL